MRHDSLFSLFVDIVLANERDPGNLAWAVPLRTGPGRDDGWDRRNDASREPDRGRANQVVLLLRRRSTL